MRTKGCHWLQPSSLRTAWAILGVALSSEACWAGLRLRLAVLMCCCSLASRSLLTEAKFCFKPVCSIRVLRDSGLAGAAWAEAKFVNKNTEISLINTFLVIVTVQSKFEKF